MQLSTAIAWSLSALLTDEQFYENATWISDRAEMATEEQISDLPFSPAILEEPVVKIIAKASTLHAAVERRVADAAHKRFPTEGLDANRYGFIEGAIWAIETGETVRIPVSGDDRAKPKHNS